MRHVVVFVLLLLLASPGAVGWGAKGFREPDTVRDVKDGYMHLTPPTGGNPVYFNGFLAQGRGPQGECVLGPVWPVGRATLECDANGCPRMVLNFVAPGCVTPSLGIPSATGGASYTPYPPQPMALLGVWRDCNEDGYIGYGDLGLWEYRTQVLLGKTTVCPTQPTPSRIPQNWHPSHNDGVWVREFLPIGWNDWGFTDASGKEWDPNIFDLNDSESRVWADWGLPDGKPGTSCYVYPVPSGTLRQSGGFVEWADCLADFRVTDSLNGSAGTVDSTPAGQISFKDAPRNQSGSASILNQRNPWGSIEDDPYVETCNNEHAVLVEADPVLGWKHTLKLPTPGATHADGSVAGQLRESYYHNTWMSCETDDYAYFQLVIAELPYRVESASQNKIGARSQTDFAFHYYAGSKPGFLVPLGKPTPTDLGARFAMPEGLWRADAASAFARPPLVARDRVDPAPVQHLTYYASVSDTAEANYGLDIIGTPSIYGSEACGTAIGRNQPVQKDWACDPFAWWPEGSMPTTGWTSTGTYGVRVGMGYNLRDVDCFDASVDALRNEGIHAGTPTGTQCDFA